MCEGQSLGLGDALLGDRSVSCTGGGRDGRTVFPQFCNLFYLDVMSGWWSYQQVLNICSWECNTSLGPAVIYIMLIICRYTARQPSGWKIFSLEGRHKRGAQNANGKLRVIAGMGFFFAFIFVATIWSLASLDYLFLRKWDIRGYWLREGNMLSGKSV